MAPQQKVRAVVKNTFVDMVDEVEQGEQRRERAATSDGTLLRYTEGKPHTKDASESLLFTFTFGDPEPECEPICVRGTSAPAVLSGISTPAPEPEPSIADTASCSSEATPPQTMMMLINNSSACAPSDGQMMMVPQQQEQQLALFCDTSSGTPVFYNACYGTDGGTVYMVPVANQDQIVIVGGGRSLGGSSQQPMAMVPQQQPMMQQMQQQRQQQEQRPQQLELHSVLNQQGGRSMYPRPQQQPEQQQQNQPNVWSRSQSGQLELGLPSGQNQQKAQQQHQQQARKELAEQKEREHWVPEHLRTTVMLRNIPNGYTSEMLGVLLDRLGFAAQYDFLYLPIDFRNLVNIGYAFVNMRDPEGARRLRERLDGFDGWVIQSPKVCEVSWSHPQQGLAEHIERYRNSPVMHESMPQDYKPRLFRNGQEVPFPPPTKPIKQVKLRKAFPVSPDETSPSSSNNLVC